MTIKFERQSLYEEVWSTPLTTLGKKYGLSDNGLRKVCKALSIPLPKAGHWAKVAAGQQVIKDPLPAKTDKTEFISHPKPVEPATPELDEDNAWLAEREKFESSPTNNILVDLQPKKFHSLLVETRLSLQEKIKQYDASKIKAEKELNQPPGRRWEPNVNAAGWSYFIRRGQLLELNRWGMPFRLTPNTCDRGLAIANSLFYAAEARGFELIKENKSNRLGFKLENETIYIRITEKLKDDFMEIKNPSKLDQLLGNNRIKVPSGILRLHLSGSGSSADIEISDTDEKPLQDKLNYAFIRMYKLIIRSRVHRRKLEEWHRQYKEQERIKEENEKIRQEAILQREAESERRAKLLSEAIDWKNADTLFNYIAHVDGLVTERSLLSTNSNTYIEWREWALNVAKNLDPSTRRINSLDLNSND